jgi:hypothetical protein
MAESAAIATPRAGERFRASLPAQRANNVPVLERVLARPTTAPAAIRQSALWFRPHLPSRPPRLGASLVKITAPLAAGSPAATPRVNGSAGMRPLRKQFVSVGFRAVYALLPNEQVRQRAVTFTQARIANAG